MTGWDFLWALWGDSGVLIISIAVALIVALKVYDGVKLRALIKKIPDEETRDDMRRTFDEIRLSNSIARHEIEGLHGRLLETKDLLNDLNKDILELHHRIQRSRRILVEKQGLVNIHKEDIQEVIDVLDGQP